MANQLEIGRQKFVLSQLLRQHPGHLFERFRGDLRFSKLGGKEMNLQLFPVVRVAVPHAGDLLALGQRHGQFFPKFPRQRLL